MFRKSCHCGSAFFSPLTAIWGYMPWHSEGKVTNTINRQWKYRSDSFPTNISKHKDSTNKYYWEILLLKHFANIAQLQYSNYLKPWLTKIKHAAFFFAYCSSGKLKVYFLCKGKQIFTDLFIEFHEYLHLI